jgi:hypothetical protein
MEMSSKALDINDTCCIYYFVYTTSEAQVVLDKLSLGMSVPSFFGSTSNKRSVRSLWFHFSTIFELDEGVECEVTALITLWRVVPLGARILYVTSHAVHFSFRSSK